MNKREAKSWACYNAADLIDSHLAAGWPDIENPDITEKEIEKLVDAVKELYRELRRRGAKALKLHKKAR